MKIFACSDLHSYFTPFKKALDEKGFEPNNPNHLLVVCGDVFDRGGESCEIYEFLNNLTNVVMVKGNHEDLMEAVWERGYCQSHDRSNGTLRTIADMFGDAANGELHEAIKLSEKTLQPFFDKMVNYFETKNYIFVHGWIPCDAGRQSRPWYQQGRKFKYNPDWRTCSDEEFAAARWINGIAAGFVQKEKVLEPGKTIVCGHWHCSYGHYQKAVRDAIIAGDSIFDVKVDEFGDDACFEPFEANGILAIDTCTAHTGKVNVVVLEDDLHESD
jgi:predicted phosphodiesterase